MEQLILDVFVPALSCTKDSTVRDHIFEVFVAIEAAALNYTDEEELAIHNISLSSIAERLFSAARSK